MKDLRWKTLSSNYLFKDFRKMMEEWKRGDVLKHFKLDI